MAPFASFSGIFVGTNNPGLVLVHGWLFPVKRFLKHLFEFCGFCTVPRIDYPILAVERPPKKARTDHEVEPVQNYTFQQWESERPVFLRLELMWLKRPFESHVASGANLGARQRSGEGVVRRNGCPKGCFWRVRFYSAPPKVFRTFQLFLRTSLKGGEKKRTLQKHPFGQPFLRTTPSPLLWRTLKIWAPLVGVHLAIRDFSNLIFIRVLSLTREKAWGFRPKPDGQFDESRVEFWRNLRWSLQVLVNSGHKRATIHHSRIKMSCNDLSLMVFCKEFYWRSHDH